MIIAIIPCRGGSEGVLQKNIAEFGGASLLSYTIAQATRSKLVDTIVVSTEDSEIKSVAASLGVQTIDRPHYLSHGDVMPWEAVRHVANHYQSCHAMPDLFLELHTTYPFRTPDLIDEAIETLSDTDCVMVGSEIYDRVWRKSDGGGYYRVTPDIPIKRRQEIEPLYIDHYGLVNVYTPRCALGGNPYKSTIKLCVTDDNRCTFDIDTPEDMEMGVKILKEAFTDYYNNANQLNRHYIPCGL